VPPLRAILLISYWGSPKRISESVKRILPRMFYHLGIRGAAPVFDQEPGVVVGEGDSYEDALADVTSAIRFHIETFGDAVLNDDSPAIKAFVAEATILA
jgi:predicted RNase H-like HicB family nuclease